LIGSDIFLFPETGPDFVRALKTAVLYSDRVHIATMAPFVPEQQLRDGMEHFPDLPDMGRSREYFQFLCDAHSDLSLLAGEGVVVMPDYVNFFSSEAASAPAVVDASNSLVSGFERLASQNDPLIKPLRRAFDIWPPSLVDLMPILAVLAHPSGFLDTMQISKSFGSIREVFYWAGWLTFVVTRSAPSEARIAFYAGMLASLATIFESRGIAPITFSPVFQNAHWAAREAFALEPDLAVQDTRRTAQARLAQVAFERHLPMVDDLPTEEILEIRRKRRPELERLQSSLAELATKVDPTGPHATIDLQIHDLVAGKVDPAVRDLDSALYSARMEALKKIGQSMESLAGAVIPLVMSVAVGAHTDVKGPASVLGGILGPLIGGEIERHRILNASQWSILLRLKKLKNKSRQPEMIPS
jgi:hypothetical protein